MAKTNYPSAYVYGYRYAPFILNADQINGDDAIGGTDLNLIGILTGYTPYYNPSVDANSTLYVNALPVFSNRANGQTLAVVRVTQALPGQIAQYDGADGQLVGATPYGGTATTTIDIDDRGDPYANQTIGADAIALGGNGAYVNYYDIYHNYGSVYVGAPSLGPAGPANAEATVKSNYFADARAQAEVGAAEQGNVATATSDAEGPHARSTAIADDYSGSRETAGAAIAFANATGTDAGSDSDSVGWDGIQYPGYDGFPESGGPITALAETSVGDPIVVSSASAIVAAPVNGSSRTEAFARIGGALPTADLPIPTGLQGIAFIQGYPDAGAADQFLSGSNPRLTSAFDDPAARVLALGELGVGSPTTTTPSVQTTTSTINYSMGFANEPGLLSDYFEAGFSPVSISGSDIQEIDFSITANGSSLLSDTFASVADAEAYFTDHVVNLGLLSTLATESNVVRSTLYGDQDPAIRFTNNLDISASLTLVGTNAQADVGLLFGTVASPSADSGPFVTLSTPYTLVNSTYVPVQGTVDLVQPGGTTIDLYDNGVYANSLTATSDNWSGDVAISGDGYHDITAKVGTSVSNDVAVTLDTTPPDLSLAPATAGLQNGTVTLSGTVSDASGIQSVDVYVGDAYTPGVATVTGTTWTYTTPALQPASNYYVEVLASDNAGNQSYAVENLPLGTGQDGYIVGATVFKDENGNGLLDAGEETTTTGSNGLFLQTDTPGTQILTGGTDSATGLPFKGTFEAPSSSIVVSPLTTVVEKVAEIAGDTTADGTFTAEEAVRVAFGLDNDLGLTEIDPIGALLDQNEDYIAYAEPIVLAASLLYDTQTLIEAAGGSSAAALTALATTIAGGGTYDAASFVAAGGLTGDAAAAVLDVLSQTEDALNQQLAVLDDGKAVLVAISGADIALQKNAVDLFTQSNGSYADAASSYDATLAQLLASNDATAQQNVDNPIACYGKGTMILTSTGEVAVEALAIGDRLVTASGDVRPIKWIGTRSYAGRFANANADVLPICFEAGSLAEGVPARDLRVSPKHAMFLEGALIPAEHLVNGVTITQAAQVERVDYFHIELDSHDVIVAEGALSESFIDDGGRAMFHNAQAFAALYPDAGPADAVYCAPRVEDGFMLEAMRQKLAVRAGIVVQRSTPLKHYPLHGTPRSSEG